MHVAKGRGALDLLSEITSFSVFRCGESNSTSTLPDYNEYANFIESYAVLFDINLLSKLMLMVPVIGMEGTVSHTRLLEAGHM